MGGLLSWFKHRNDDSLVSLAFEHNPIATVVTDANGMILMINRAFEQLSGYHHYELVGERMSVLKSGEYSHAYYKSFWHKLSKAKSLECDMKNRRKDGSIICLHEKIQAVGKGSARKYVISVNEIDESEQMLERYQHLAMHDPLTGLANRLLLNDRFKHATLNAARLQKKVGVILCDLNEFKAFNDTYGHVFGDKILKAVTDKLTQSVRESDTVARYGGDEFVIVLEQLDDIHELRSVVETLKANLPVRCQLEGIDCEISMSIGSSCFPEEGSTFEQLIELSDVKMYQEKKNYYGIEL